MNSVIKSRLALFAQVVIVLIGLGTLVFLLWEPHVEGRNAKATAFEVYFHDPFLAYVYGASIPYFVALYQAFGLFGDLRQNRAFSRATVEALRVIQRCALTLIGLVMLGLVFILRLGDPEDRPVGFVISLFVVLAASAVALVATLVARRVGNCLGSCERDDAH